MRRFIAVLLAAALLVPTASARTLSLYSDYAQLVANAKKYGENEQKYINALQLLSNLSIMGAGSSINDGSSLTRAELYTMIYVLRNKGGMTMATRYALCAQTVPFDDIKPDEWYYPYFVWAYQNGLSGGTGARKMSPHMTLDYYQCLQALMAVLGNDNAKSGLDYNNRIVTLAFAESTFRLSRGFESRDESAITRGEVAVLISHLLEARPIAYGANNAIIYYPHSYGYMHFNQNDPESW